MKFVTCDFGKNGHAGTFTASPLLRGTTLFSLFQLGLIAQDRVHQ